MSEAFQLILNSQGANCLDVGAVNKSSLRYSVNWGAFLPKKYKKYHCQFVFKSNNYVGVLQQNGFVNINLGHVNCFDGSAMSSNLGMIYPVVLTAVLSYYSSTNNDNNDFWISYPSNQIITVNLLQFDNVTALANVPNYTIFMNFKGVHDDEILGD